jgi:Golgi nucleoside diphosphatase
MVVIDAGSSGSRAHIFYYTHSSNGLLPIVQLPQASHKISPGLSSYENEPDSAGRHLRLLTQYVQDQVRTHLQCAQACYFRS